MARVCDLVCAMLFLATMVSFASPVSAQLLPEVILTCDDDAEINSGDTKTAIIMCEAENPGTFQEKVSIQVESGELANAAPNSIIIAAGNVVEFQISLRSDDAEEPGEIPVNVTATITEVNGVPYPLGSSDSEEIIVTIVEYQYCGASIGQGGGIFDGGDEISISAAINCNSNREGEVSYQVHLIKNTMGSSSWPNGFEKPNNCDINIDVGETGGNCNFKIGTPDNLDSDWEGCIVIIEVDEVRPNSCPNSNKVDIKIKKKSAGLGLELGGNESLIEQLGITEEQLPVIGGAIGIILVIFGGFIYYRRMGREYE